MAATSATIHVTFTSWFTGTHRICWRIGGSGAYDCSTLVSCGGAGTTCTAEITVSLDNETCDAVTFEGYVQATCEEESSTNDRIAFTTTFTPSPACSRWEVTCNSVALASITILNGGSGYNDMAPPAAVITGGGGSGATAIVTVTGGIVTDITLDSVGSGYTSVPTITVDPASPGVTATAEAVLGYCSGFSSQDCVGSPGTFSIPAGAVQAGETFNLCNSVEPTVPADYSIVENGNCLCDCTQVTLLNSSGVDNINIHYMACTGKYNMTTLGIGGSFTMCMVSDSIISENVPISSLTITVGEACPAG